MEGFSAPDRGAGGMNALSFLTRNPESLVPALFDVVTKTQISGPIFILNLVVSVFVVLFFLATAAKRLIDTGNTGRPDGDGGLAWWIFRFVFGALLVTPAPDYSLGQRAVIGVALAGSGFADRIAVALGPARDAMRPNTSSSAALTPLAVSAASAQGGTVIARLFQMRWCQWHLNHEVDRAVIPAPTVKTTFDGTTIWQFGGLMRRGQNVPDACGSLSLPMPADSRADASWLDRQYKNFSDVSQTIIDAHVRALTVAANKTAQIVSTYPTTPGSPNLEIDQQNAWRGRVREQARELAREYDAAVIAAGGGLAQQQQHSAQAQANQLDPRWGWVRYGLDFHRRATSATAVVNALSWIPTFSEPRLNDSAAQSWRMMGEYMTQDMRAAGLLPAVPASSGSSSGFDIASLIGVTQLRAAMNIFSTPTADVFEVAGIVGPVLTNISSAALLSYAAVSAFAPGIGSFVSLLFGTMLAIGQTLSLALPMAPLVAWVFLVLSWFYAALALLIALPFSAITLARDDEPALWSQSVSPLVGHFLQLLCLPALITIGMTLITPILQFGWFLISTAVMPIAQAGMTGSALGVAFGALFAALFVISTLISLVYFSVSKVSGIAQLVTQKLAFLSARAMNLSSGERISGGENTSSAPIGGGTRAAAPAPGANPTPGIASGPGSGMTNPQSHVAASVPQPKK